ncbi:hypothetical protein [Sporosarcina newyorkensis]|uniref:Uncharacterized protein n=2 Tax=Sporosarcina newyorkensis TaxID=759851 RepID=A0A1T4YK87_9BACL|nr:hypothetical protein [Sporosarcina newyorkensis]EGQ21753.1 hypothetical protein HMPREF9372_3113 [Sporosarcina newyorkensis 2681]SKB02166.1 hypothetical protein SAMN04244570_2854 [Sporosarcina newyorkensis]
MAEELSCDESQIWILGQPLICRFCGHDVFMPYQTYRNVEEPGIDVYFMNYTAVCMECGYGTQFSDPSHFNPDGVYIWAFEQALHHPPEPEPPVIRVVDAETLQAEKRCLDLALQVLVKEGKVDEFILPLAEEEYYEQVLELLGQKKHKSTQEANAMTCLAVALSEIASYRLVDNEKILFIIEHESYPGIETFLEQHIK